MECAQDGLLDQLCFENHLRKGFRSHTWQMKNGSLISPYSRVCKEVGQSSD